MHGGWTIAVVLVASLLPSHVHCGLVISAVSPEEIKVPEYQEANLTLTFKCEHEACPARKIFLAVDSWHFKWDDGMSASEEIPTRASVWSPELGPAQTQNLSLSFTPEMLGIYHLEIFADNARDNPANFGPETNFR